MQDNHRNQGVLGTFLSGALGIVTVFILVILLAPFVPWLVILAACFYLGWLFATPYFRKKNQEASLEVKDDD